MLKLQLIEAEMIAMRKKGGECAPGTLAVRRESGQWSRMSRGSRNEGGRKEWQGGGTGERFHRSWDIFQLY